MKIVPWRLAVEDYAYTGYVVYCCMFIMIFIDHFLAYMHIRGIYKKYTRVGDFDTPTHQPTNSIYIYCEPLYTLYIETIYGSLYNLHVCSHLPGMWKLEVQVSQTRGVQRQGNCGACRYAGNASTACDWWGVGGRVVHCHQLLQVVAHLKDRNNGC